MSELNLPEPGDSASGPLERFKEAKEIQTDTNGLTEAGRSIKEYLGKLDSVDQEDSKNNLLHLANLTTSAARMLYDRGLDGEMPESVAVAVEESLRDSGKELSLAGGKYLAPEKPLSTWKAVASQVEQIQDDLTNLSNPSSEVAKGVAINSASLLEYTQLVDERALTGEVDSYLQEKLSAIKRNIS